MRSTDLQLQSLRNDVIWESILLGLFCDVACLARACAFCQAPLLKLYGLYWAEGKYEIGVGVKNPPLEPHTTIRSRTPRSPPIIQKWDKIKQGHLKNSSNWRGVFWFFADFCVLRKWRWRTTFGYEVAICNWRMMAANSVFLAVSGLGNNDDDHGSSTLFWRKRQKSYAIFPIWPQVARLPNSYWRIRWPLHLTAIFSSLDKDDNLEFKSCPCMMHTAEKL